MIKYIFIGLISLALFNGCSAKEINAGVDSITSDVSNAFEGSKDNSE